jgi:hypothetical protein
MADVTSTGLGFYDGSESIWKFSETGSASSGSNISDLKPSGNFPLNF